MSKGVNKRINPYKQFGIYSWENNKKGQNGYPLCLLQNKEVKSIEMLCVITLKFHVRFMSCSNVAEHSLFNMKINSFMFRNVNFWIIFVTILRNRIYLHQTNCKKNHGSIMALIQYMRYSQIPSFGMIKS